MPTVAELLNVELDSQRKRWQMVTAWRDLGWEWWSERWGTPSLASLHANPAHSALRRVRHFDHAWTALSAHFDHVECAITHRAVYRQIGNAADATMAVLWSVR